MNVVTDHNEMGTDGRSGSMSVISHSLYFKTWQFGKELCYESFLGLLCSCVRTTQVESDSGKDRKWADVSPPQLHLWGT